MSCNLSKLSILSIGSYNVSALDAIQYLNLFLFNLNTFIKYWQMQYFMAFIIIIKSLFFLYNSIK